MQLAERQSASGANGITPPGVSQQTFLGFTWAGVGVSVVFLSVRLFSRFRGPGRLYLDDGFAMFAAVLVIVTGALWQWAAKDMYYTLEVQAGIQPFEPDFFDRLHRWLMVSMMVELFFYTALLSIKLSFLFFFRRLGNNVNNFKWLWWPALAISGICYTVSVGNEDYKCLIGPTEYIIGTCNAPDHIHFTGITLKVNCALDVFSDFMIMLLPIVLLWDVRLQRAKKLAFIGLFSLSLITMVIATVRAADIDVTRRPDGQIDNTYLWLWSAIEPPVAIMVCCLSAVPALFRSSTINKKPAFSPSETYLRMMSRIRSSRNNTGGKSGNGVVTLTDLSMVSTSDGFDYIRTPEGPETHARHYPHGATAVATTTKKQPALVPHATYQNPVVQCYRSDSGSQDELVPVREARGRILQQFEYKVTSRSYQDV